MKNTDWIKIIKEIIPHKKVAEILSESKLKELKNEDRIIANFSDTSFVERLPDFDFWFSWN